MPQNLKTAKPHTISAMVRPERLGDNSAIQQMYCEAFGPGRFARTAYRIREQSGYNKSLSCIIEREGQVVGALRFSEILIGGRSGGLLLGPLVVSTAFRGSSYGETLIEAGLKRAGEAGFKLVLLVGDLAYYQRVGFVSIPEGHICLPAPFNPDRLLAYEIKAETLKDYRGIISN